MQGHVPMLQVAAEMELPRIRRPENDTECRLRSRGDMDYLASRNYSIVDFLFLC